MSAPPIGMMISTPSTKAMAVISQKGVQPWVAVNQMPHSTMAMARMRLSACWPAKVTGAPWNRRNLYLPESLPKAMTEPEKVMAPTKVPMNSSMRLPTGMGSPWPTMLKAQGSATQAMAMNTAARPIIECMKATSSGILVISTRRAMTVPAEPPTSRPKMTSAMPEPLDWVPAAPCSFRISATVVTMAISMPTMPKTLPRREVVGCDSPFRAWMKHTEATRYNRTTRFMLIRMLQKTIRAARCQAAGQPAARGRRIGP